MSQFTEASYRANAYSNYLELKLDAEVGGHNDR